MALCPEAGRERLIAESVDFRGRGSGTGRSVMTASGPGIVNGIAFP